MTTLLLSGMGGTSNWLPLLFPIVLIVTIVVSVEYLTKQVKRRRLATEQDQDDDNNILIEDAEMHYTEHMMRQ